MASLTVLPGEAVQRAGMAGPHNKNEAYALEAKETRSFISPGHTTSCGCHTENGYRQMRPSLNPYKAQEGIHLSASGVLA